MGFNFTRDLLPKFFAFTLSFFRKKWNNIFSINYKISFNDDE